MDFLIHLKLGEKHHLEFVTSADSAGHRFPAARRLFVPALRGARLGAIDVLQDPPPGDPTNWWFPWGKAMENLLFLGGYGNSMFFRGYGTSEKIGKTVLLGYGHLVFGISISISQIKTASLGAISPTSKDTTWGSQTKICTSTKNKLMWDASTDKVKTFVWTTKHRCNKKVATAMIHGQVGNDF